MTGLLRGTAVISAALALMPAFAHRPRDQGGVADASGAYSAIFAIEQSLPEPELTPGATNLTVTQGTIGSTICVRGYTRTIRPSESYISPLKRWQIREYGYADHRMRDYEEDHLVALEIGGSPSDPRNLWPEPHNVIGGWGSYAKDRLENRLHALVCRGRIPLVAAQSMMEHDWIAAYKRFIGPAPTRRRHRNVE